MLALFAIVLPLIAHSTAQSSTAGIMPSTAGTSTSSSASVSSPALSFPTDVPPVVQGEAIVAHFTNAGLIPSLFKNFTPSAILSVSYNDVGNILPGQNLTVDQVKAEPQILVAPLDSSEPLSGIYTLAMLDAGVVGDNQSDGQMRHWLVNGVTISGNSLSFANSTNITDYVGPSPPPGEGAHRYVFALFIQPKSFSPTNDLATPGQPLGPMDISQYINGTGLGPLIAGMYFDAERGISTLSVSPTSPVITSTLPGFSTSTPSSKPVASPALRGENSGSKLTCITGLVLSLLMSVMTA